MGDLGIGSLIQHEDDVERDAIHIAVAPVSATTELRPGQPVGLANDSIYFADPDAEPVGVVDPFLKAPVPPFQRFWLFLYPQTITTLRHEWTHPAFKRIVGVDSDARRWIEGFAAELDLTYNRLMSAAETWLEEEEYTWDNSETYKNVAAAKWPEFWGHYAIVTGRADVAEKIARRGVHFFTCSC